MCVEMSNNLYGKIDEEWLGKKTKAYKEIKRMLLQQNGGYKIWRIRFDKIKSKRKKKKQKKTVCLK